MSLGTSLEDDIARVARLRGRSVADCIDSAERLKARRKLEALNDQRITYLFATAQAGDLKDFDRLPHASKAFIHELLQPPSATTWRVMLASVDGDEEALIAAVRAWLDENVPYDTRRAYGPAHPGAVDD